MTRWTRRAATTTVAAATVMLMGANAAFAHYCAKTDFNDRAREKVVASSAWMDGETFLGYLEAEAEEYFPACFDVESALAVFEEFFDAHPDWAFKGPGLLAGGAHENGKLPPQFSHELGGVFDEAEAVGMAGCA